MELKIKFELKPKAWQAAKSSIAKICSTFAITFKAFLADQPPIETWSSVPPDVVIVSFINNFSWIE